MDKIITINLGGFSIKIDEDAFLSLKNYIDAIERKYSATENGKEIINDIETRIAELLIENLNGKVASSLADVESAKKSMGNPEEFEQSTESNEEKKYYNKDIPKRLYRDSENKTLGGVCSGISKYFDIDPTIVRIFWVCLVLFFGTGILVYFLLWIIVPEAVTTAQKLEMNGKAPTMDNIINKVKFEAENVSNNIKSKNIGEKIREFIKSILPVLLFVFKSFAIIMGVILLFFFSILIIVLVSGTSSFVINNSGISATKIPDFFNESWEFVSFKVLIGLFIGIPLFNVITRLLKFAFNSKVNYQPIRKILSFIWIFTIPLIIYFAYLGLSNFKNLEINQREYKEITNSGFTIKSAINDDEFFGSTKYKIEVSSDSFIHVLIKETASGSSKTNAISNAKKIGADYEFKNNILLLKKSDYYSKTGLYRRQKTEFVILVPNSIKFKLSPEFVNQNLYVQGSNIVYIANKRKDIQNELIFLKGNLYCPVCSDSLPHSINSISNSDKFSKIEISGWMDVEVVKGSIYDIQTRGDNDIVNNIETEIKNDILEISLNDKFINLKSKPKIIITLPELSELKLSGAIECNIDSFNGNTIKIEADGASIANVDLHYQNIEIEINGASKLDISGKANNVSFDCAGAASINSENLTSKSVNIDITGASQIKIGKTNSIIGIAKGASKIEYTGKPFYDVKSSGLSKVKHY